MTAPISQFPRDFSLSLSNAQLCGLWFGWWRREAPPSKRALVFPSDFPVFTGRAKSSYLVFRSSWNPLEGDLTPPSWLYPSVVRFVLVARLYSGLLWQQFQGVIDSSIVKLSESGLSPLKSHIGCGGWNRTWYEPDLGSWEVRLVRPTFTTV